MRLEIDTNEAGNSHSAECTRHREVARAHRVARFKARRAAQPYLPALTKMTQESYPLSRQVTCPSRARAGTKR